MELLFLRLIHICAGAFWIGATIYLAAFIEPAVKAMGPEGGKFMQQLMRTNKLPLWMTLMATLNVLTGLRLIMIYIVNGGMDWVTTHTGICFSLGGLLAIAAYIVGISVNRPVAMKMQAIGAEIAKTGAPPTAEQAAQLATLKERLGKATRVIAWHLGAAIVLMCIAKYV